MKAGERTLGWVATCANKLYSLVLERLAQCALHKSKQLWLARLVKESLEVSISYMQCAVIMFSLVEIPGSVQGERGGGQVAILARYNATLFSEMVRVTSAPQPVRIGFAGVG